jgi:L-amino acid N-acyltransferase YncA
MRYTHRPAKLDDLPAIVAIYNSTVASHEVTADTEPVTIESRRAWFAEHDPKIRPLWVAQQQGISSPDIASPNDIAGWLSFSDFYGRPAYAGTAEISVYIHQDARRRGLGYYLIQEAIDFAPSISVHTLLGFIFAHNVPSLKLFDAFGFERWANLPRVATLDGIERDLIIVGKRIA